MFFFRRTTGEELQQKHLEEERKVLVYISEAVNPGEPANLTLFTRRCKKKKKTTPRMTDLEQ